MSRRHSLVKAGAVTGVLMLALAVSGRTQGRLSALPTSVPAPPDNPTTPERVALGRLLFWDPILSGSRDIACATCHHPAYGYADNRDLSIGTNGVGLGPARMVAADQPVHVVKRNSQTVLNAAFNGLSVKSPASPSAAPMFWDLRVRSLEAQALEPLKALDEMRGEDSPAEHALDVLVARLAAIPEYRTRFAQAFGGDDSTNALNLGRAIAAFERSLVTPNAPFDRYVRGDTTAMTADEIRGMERFQSIGCIDCHSGPMLSDFSAHVLGVPDNPKLTESDSGVDKTYAFRTPSLRNLASTAPYMHNGVFASLGDVVRFYSRVSRGGRGFGGGRGQGGGRGGRGFRGGLQNPAVTPDQIDPLVRQLDMRGGRQDDLIAFLGALDDPGFDRTVPERVPSGLSVGGRLGR